MAPPLPFQNTIAADLASGNPELQASSVLAVIALMSAGRDVTAYVSLICQLIVGNPNVPLDLRLKAYDIIKGSILSDADSQLLVQGILSDLRLDPSPANEHVQAAALVAMQSLPTHRLIAFMGDPDVIQVVRTHLRGGQPLARSAGAQSIATVMSFDTMMKLLAENKDLKDMFSTFVKNMSCMLVDAEPELTLGGARALTSLLGTMSLKVRNSALTGRRSKESSNYSQGLVLALSICEDAVLTVDGMFAEMLPRFRALGPDVKRQILTFLVSYLDAKVLVYSLNSFDHRPGEILRHQMDEVVNFLAECATDCDPPLVVESTKALLSLAEIDKSSSSLYSQMTISIQASIDSIKSLEGRYHHVAQQGLLDAFLSHMDALPAAQQATLFGKLPLMIATVPSARQRIKSFVKLWSSVAAYDWKLNSCITHGSVDPGPRVATTPASGGASKVPDIASMIAANGASMPAPASPGATQAVDYIVPSEVQHILLEKHMKDCVAGGRDPQSRAPHVRYQDPIFREEVVGSLLYVLLTHPAPVTGLTNSASLGKTSANSALVAATGIQAVGTALDWLSTSRSSLQNTKPCLGWDRVVGVSTTGTTACVDLWLQLLLRCINISEQLKARLDGVRNVATGPGQVADGPGNVEKDSGDAHGSSGALGSGARVSSHQSLLPMLKQRAAVLEMEFQALLLQIATNWRALHPVARPRAIWICAYNLRMKSALDAAWGSMSDALRALLVEAEHMGSSNPSRYFASAAEGSIKTYPATDSKTRSPHDPFVAAAAGETEEICVLVLERLSNLVASNHHGELQGKLADIGKLLASLSGVCTSKKHLSPSSTQRLERVQRLLAPIASSGASGASGPGADERDAGMAAGSGRVGTISLRHSVVTKVQKSNKGGTAADKTSRTVAVELKDDLPRNSASYPSTVPSSPSLVHSDVVRRYQQFLGDLQSAIVSSEDLDQPNQLDQGGHLDVGANANIGLPGLGAALEVLDAHRHTWIEVTGVFSPLVLSFHHSLEPSSSTIRLKCRLENRTLEKIAGVEVQLMMGGPIAMHRRPLVYKMRTLDSWDSHEWEIPCRCLSFGWPVVQAFVALPVDCPSIAAHTYQQGAVRCKPYAVSPLELILKSHRPLFSAEFFQVWQTFPHRANAYASPKEQGMRGIVKVLSAIESSGLVCSSKVLVPVPGGVHAAYSGISWSGHTIALIVSSVSSIGETSNHKGIGARKGEKNGRHDLPACNADWGEKEGAVPTVLHFHFGSDVSEVIFPMRGHEHDLVNQLTKGRATPVSSPLIAKLASRSGASGASGASGTADPDPFDQPRGPQSTFSFFKSMVGSYDTEEDDSTDKKRAALLQKQLNLDETYALTSAAVHAWRSLVGS